MATVFKGLDCPEFFILFFYLSNEKYILKENIPITLGVYSGKSAINSNYNAQIYLKV